MVLNRRELLDKLSASAEERARRRFLELQKKGLTDTYDEVLAKHLAVMDLTATSLAMENDIPVVVFALADPQNIVRAVMGEAVGTVVTK